MRRQDRDATVPQQIDEILSVCTTGRVGFLDAGVPYIVPLHFVADRDPASDDAAPAWRVYVHGALTGHKMELIGEGAAVGFETDRVLTDVPGSDACGSSTYFESVIGRGWAEVVSDPAEKRRALTLITRKYAPGLDDDFSTRPVDFVAIVRVRLDSATAKRHLPDPPAE